MFEYVPSLTQICLSKWTDKLPFSLWLLPLVQEMSVELSLEDVKKVASHYGFTLEVSYKSHICYTCIYILHYFDFVKNVQRESTIATTYTTNSQSMMQVRLTM